MTESFPTPAGSSMRTSRNLHVNIVKNCGCDIITKVEDTLEGIAAPIWRSLNDAKAGI